MQDYFILEIDEKKEEQKPEIALDKLIKRLVN